MQKQPLSYRVPGTILHQSTYSSTVDSRQYTYLVRRRVGRLVEVDHSVPHVLLQLALQGGATARDGHVVRRSALEVIVVAEQQGPLGRVQSRLAGLGLDHELRGGLRGGAIVAVPFSLGLLRALLLLLDVACGQSKRARGFTLSL